MKYGQTLVSPNQHPRWIAMNQIKSETISRIVTTRKPSDHAYLVMNSVMCTLDEMESWTRVQKVCKIR